MIKIIALDADETLWHNEKVYLDIREKFIELLLPYHEKDWIIEHLNVVDRRNLKYFGYGIKGFTLSMIETAVELTEGRIRGFEILQIIDFARLMIEKPIEIIEGVRETLSVLAPDYFLMMISQGDLLDQETKLARSGLGEFFRVVEIVSKKNERAYRKIIEKYEIDPREFLMVGNSVRADVLPVLETGANAVHIPYEMKWFGDIVSEEELDGTNFAKLQNISELPGFIKNTNDRNKPALER